MDSKAQVIPANTTHIQLPIQVWNRVDRFLGGCPYNQVSDLVTIIRHTISPVVPPPPKPVIPDAKPLAKEIGSKELKCVK